MPAAARRLPSAAGRHAPRYSAAADAVPASRGPAPAPALSGSGPDSGCGWSAAGGWADRRPAADRSRRRLLEGFEQGIGGIQIHRLGRMQYHYLAPTLLRCLCHEVGQLPYRIDTNGLAFLLRLHQQTVRVGAGTQQLAAAALTADRSARRLLTQQPVSEGLGELTLAHPRAAGEQKGVGLTRPGGQSLPDRLMPGTGRSPGLIHGHGRTPRLWPAAWLRAPGPDRRWHLSPGNARGRRRRARDRSPAPARRTPDAPVRNDPAHCAPGRGPCPAPPARRIPAPDPDAGRPAPRSPDWQCAAGRYPGLHPDRRRWRR